MKECWKPLSYLRKVMKKRRHKMMKKRQIDFLVKCSIEMRKKISKPADIKLQLSWVCESFEAETYQGLRQ